MINLTKQAVDLITEPTQGYIAQARQRLGGFMPNTRKWNFIINLYSFVADQLIKKNNSLYDVYTFVIDEMQKLLLEKFGITIDKPTENHRFYRCKYSKATDTVRYADTRGYEAIHRFIDVETDNGITYVTVQHFADRLYLIPSHKVVYKIGEGNVFLGCEIAETGNYEPYELR
jgi:hypothetical protein